MVLERDAQLSRAGDRPHVSDQLAVGPAPGIANRTDLHAFDCSDEMFASARLSLEPGAVVLAHDGVGPGALPEGADETVAYVQLVIDHARRCGISPRSLGAA